MLRQRIAVDRTLDDDIRLNGRCHGRKDNPETAPIASRSVLVPESAGLQRLMCHTGQLEPVCQIGTPLRTL
jgi:hypothetical protein